MTTTTTITRHAFLTPGHNCWNIWSCEGTTTITNPGTSHRVLESLSYAVDSMIQNGWKVENIFVEQGTPTLVFFSRRDEVEAADEAPTP